MNEPQIIKSQKDAPDTQSWYEYVWKAEQDTPNRLEDAAKFMATMISISFTIFLSDGKNAFENYQDSLYLKIALISWIISLLSAFLVLFPQKYQYISCSAADIKKTNKKIINRKNLFLIISLSLYLLALGIIGILFFIRA
jgi:hypothetical protein